MFIKGAGHVARAPLLALLMCCSRSSLALHHISNAARCKVLAPLKSPSTARQGV